MWSLCLAETRKVSLGEYHSILASDVMCYDVSIWQEDHIVICRVGGIDVFHLDSGEVIQTIAMEGWYSFVAEPYKDILVVAKSTISRSNKEIVIFDKEYVEIRNWSVSTSTSDLAVVDDKIFLSSDNEECGNLHVFTLQGNPLPDFLWNGRPCGVVGVLPCSIIFGDSFQHKLYKQQVTTGRRQIVWSRKVKAPRCICLDDNGMIWSRSNANDCLSILSRQGKISHKVSEKRLLSSRWKHLI